MILFTKLRAPSQIGTCVGCFIGGGFKILDFVES